MYIYWNVADLALWLTECYWNAQDGDIYVCVPEDPNVKYTVFKLKYLTSALIRIKGESSKFNSLTNN